TWLRSAECSCGRADRVCRTQVAVTEQRPLSPSRWISSLFGFGDCRGCLVDVFETVRGDPRDAEIRIERTGIDLRSGAEVLDCRRVHLPRRRAAAGLIARGVARHVRVARELFCPEGRVPG